MSFEIKPLTEKDDAELVLLFKSAAHDKKLWMWQDRGPRFFDLWKLAQDHVTHHYLGLFHNGRLIGCSGRNSCRLPEPFAKNIGYIDTDLFIHETYRTSIWGAKLFKARMDHYSAEVSLQGLLWGIEHEPGGLSIGNSYAKRTVDQKFYFPFESVLSHSSVFENVTNVENRKNLLVMKLKDVPLSLIESFTENYRQAQTGETVFPLLDDGFLKRLQALEPEAQIMTDQGQTMGALLCSLRTLRRWKSTGLNSLLLERLRRIKGWPSLQGQEIKFQMLGMSWGPSEELNTLYGKAISLSHEQGFDFLVTRDFAPAKLDPKATHFKRRVFFGYTGLQTDNGKDILDWTKDPKVRFRAEVFLV